MSETDKEIAIGNNALRICYKKYSRATKYLPNLPEKYRIEFMKACQAEQLFKLRKKEKERVKSRTIEQQQERGIERLERIKLEKEMNESLGDPWE